jgi:hypothetical protein
MPIGRIAVGQRVGIGDDIGVRRQHLAAAFAQLLGERRQSEGDERGSLALRHAIGGLRECHRRHRREHEA